VHRGAAGRTPPDLHRGREEEKKCFAFPTFSRLSLCLPPQQSEGKNARREECESRIEKKREKGPSFSILVLMAGKKKESRFLSRRNDPVIAPAGGGKKKKKARNGVYRRFARDEKKRGERRVPVTEEGHEAVNQAAKSFPSRDLREKKKKKVRRGKGSPNLFSRPYRKGKRESYLAGGTGGAPGRIF